MALSYGTITIVDNTDLGQLSTFLSTDKYKEQIADINTNPVTYNPDWNTSAGIVITPTIYHNGEEIHRMIPGNPDEIPNPQLQVLWYEDGQQVDGTGYQGSASALSNYTCKRVGNLSATGNRHVTYRADITYYPVANDHSLFLKASATIELTCVSVGANGQDGTPAKSLQLTSNKGYFTYDWHGQIYGEHAATITSNRSSAIAGIAWFYTDATGTEIPLPTSLVVNSGSSSQFTGNSITIDTNNAWQSALFNSLSARGQISFTVKETTQSGGTTIVTNGFQDSVSIMRYQEASPGDSVYTSYLDNNEETVSVYDNILDLHGAVSKLYINKNGYDDLENWNIQLSDNIINNSDFTYIGWNTKDYPNGIYRGISSTIITNNGTQAPTINGTVVPTSSLTANDLVIYSTSIFCWNGTKWIIPTQSYLTTYGPDKVAVTSMNVNSATITFTARHGTYSGTNFSPDSGDDAVSDLISNFTISKSSSIISHSLRISTAGINRDANGVYSPSQIIMDAISRTGGSTEPMPYREAGVIKYTINYASGQPSTGTNTSGQNIQLDLSNESREITLIEITLGSASPWEDTQTVVVSNDGSSPYNINVPNQTDTISTTFDYKPNDTFSIDVPFLVMHGITEQGVNVYESASTVYPRVKTSAIYKTIGGISSSTGITPTFYYNDTSRSQGIVNKVKATLGTNVIIGESGYFDLTFELTSSIEKTVRYTYTSVPEALSPLSLHLYPTPADTFINQTGTIIVEPTVLSGASEITSNLTYLWEIYDSGSWKKISNSTTSDTDKYYDANNNIFYSNRNTIHDKDSTDISLSNGTANSKYLHVQGAGVHGYGSFRCTATYTTTQAEVTEQIPLKDINDPVQVEVLSTVGEQIINGQGMGVIYAKVTKGDEEIDPVASKLVVTSTQPTGSDNTGVFKGMLGCVYKSGNTLTYYSRTTTTGDGSTWTQRSSTRCSYHWTFRNKNNEPIIGDEQGLNSYLVYIITGNSGQGINTQFIYVDKDVIDNKLTADVRVSLT